jgi:hypothetical protein
MATYYCDLSDGTFVDRTGVDVANEYTGPAGFMAAMRGTGNATALAATDTLWLCGTGDLQRLILMDCAGTDVTAGGLGWAVGDVVRNKDGAGDDWTGVIVETNDGGFLGADDMLLIWLDAGKSEDDINVADGVENTTQMPAESVDPITSAIAPGINMNGIANGDNTGRIRIRGTTDLTDPTNNLGQAVLDCQVNAGATAADDGTSCTLVVTFISLEYITVQNAADDGIYCSAAASNDWQYIHCLTKDCGDMGLYAGGARALVHRCISRDNSADDNFYLYANVTAAFCLSEGSGDYGFNANSSGGVFYCCIGFGNADDNFYSTGDAVRLLNCVGDGSTGGSGWYYAATTVTEGCVALGSRFTNNNQYGIESGQAGTEYENYEDFNVIYQGAGAGKRLNMDAGPNSIDDSADDGIDVDYNVENGKDLDSTEVVLNWDGA